MNFVVSFISLLPLLPNLLFIFWLYKSRPKSRIYFISIHLFVMLFTATTIVSFGYWFTIGMYWPVLIVGLLCGVLYKKYTKGVPLTWLPKVFTKEFFLTSFLLLLTLPVGMAFFYVGSSKSYAISPLNLSYPLEGGVFVVMAGGSNWSVNNHAYLSVPTAKYALDITKLNAFGMRASGLTPSDNNAYSVFESTVVAPCTGEVIEAQNDHEDQMPLNPGSNSLLGNRVVIYCEGHSVVLGHLQEGSILVKIGDFVESGQAVARVGSSGSVLEPHLHIQAVVGRERLATNDSIVTHESVPITFNGRFMIKHEWFVN